MSTTKRYAAYVVLYDAVRNVPGDACGFWRMCVNYCSTDIGAAAEIIVPICDQHARDPVGELRKLTDKAEILSRLAALKTRFSYTKTFR